MADKVIIKLILQDLKYLAENPKANDSDLLDNLKFFASPFKDKSPKETDVQRATLLRIEDLAKLLDIKL